MLYSRTISVYEPFLFSIANKTEDVVAFSNEVAAALSPKSKTLSCCYFYFILFLLRGAARKEKLGASYLTTKYRSKKSRPCLRARISEFCQLFYCVLPLFKTTEPNSLAKSVNCCSKELAFLNVESNVNLIQGSRYVPSFLGIVRW